MNTVERDFNCTRDIINGSSLTDEYYNSIYFHSNEHLKDIFGQIDVKGKKCFDYIEVLKKLADVKITDTHLSQEYYENHVCTSTITFYILI